MIINKQAPNVSLTFSVASSSSLRLRDRRTRTRVGTLRTPFEKRNLLSFASTRTSLRARRKPRGRAKKKVEMLPKGRNITRTPRASVIRFMGSRRGLLRETQRGPSYRWRILRSHDFWLMFLSVVIGHPAEAFSFMPKQQPFVNLGRSKASLRFPGSGMISLTRLLIVCTTVQRSRNMCRGSIGYIGVVKTLSNTILPRFTKVTTRAPRWRGTRQHPQN